MKKLAVFGALVLTLALAFDAQARPRCRRCRACCAISTDTASEATVLPVSGK